jgi:hypothetical protein
MKGVEQLITIFLTWFEWNRGEIQVVGFGDSSLVTAIVS